jgi:Zn-dependent protease
MLIIAPPILFALSFHEYAHGYVANRLGDPTAKNSGRLTLNPIAHLDPIGTLMLFLVHFGWAKPVPVNLLNLRDPKRDMLWVALAGPASNMFLAFVFGMIIRFIGVQNFRYLSMGNIFDLLLVMLVYAVIINLALAVFNLLPIPPLDGAKILYALIPSEHESSFHQYEQYGSVILVGLILMGMFLRIPILWYFIEPFVKIFSIIFAGIDLSYGL